jgi:hypothetical protein
MKIHIVRNGMECNRWAIRWPPMLTAALFGKLALAEAIERALAQFDEQLLKLQLFNVPWVSGWLEIDAFIFLKFF